MYTERVLSVASNFHLPFRNIYSVWISYMGVMAFKFRTVRVYSLNANLQYALRVHL